MTRLRPFLACVLLLGAGAARAQNVRIMPVPIVPVAPIVPGVAVQPMIQPALPVLAAPQLRLSPVPLAQAPQVQPHPAAARPHVESAPQQGRGLLSALSRAIGANYREHTYGEAGNFLFSQADSVVRNGVQGVVDAYSGVFVPGTSTEGSDYKEKGDQNGDGFVDSGGMNVEHVWPQSFFAKRLPMKSDLHHLMATFIHPNGVRSSMPFGEVRGPGEYSNKGGAKAGQGVFEPPDATKGRVARALLYFYTRYYDRNIYNAGYSQDFWNARIEIFLRWNRDFPPDEMELRRNDLVERFQGNRNPYVDDPSLADRIGVEGFMRAGRYDDLQRQLDERWKGVRLP
ncbi:MAG: endonuclease [Elusimicrobiota bacterium]